MRPLCSTLALLLLSGTATTAPVPKAVKAKSDDTLILGTWKAVKPGEHTHTHTFEADGHLRQLFGKDGVSDWDWQVFPDETPKRLTMVNQKSKTDAWHAVYELTGDSLRITYAAATSPLPKAVGAGGNSWTYDLVRDTTK